MIEDSFKGNYFSKAVECIQSLRAGSITKDKSIDFNKFLTEIKVRYSEGKFSGLWDLIIQLKITLITDRECIGTGVTTDQAARFLINSKKDMEKDMEIEKEIEEEKLIADIE